MKKTLQEISFREEDNVKRVFVDFRILSDILVPSEISKELGVSPSRAYAKGERFKSKVRNPKTMQYSYEWIERTNGVWMISTDNLISSLIIEDHLQYLLKILSPIKDKIAPYLLKKDNYRISFYVHWEPLGDWGSYEVNNSTLNQITLLCHYIEFAFMSN